MADTPKLNDLLHADERLWLTRILEEPLNDTHLLIYADWLEEKGDRRAPFLRQYVAAARSMNPKDFPSPKQMPEEWLELIGFRLLEQAAKHGSPELKEPLLTLGRPALRMVAREMQDKKIPVGASKIGGLPDLPPDYAWPLGNQCHAIYNDDTAEVEELAAFLCQVNLAEIAETQAGRLLPSTGLLSFFSYQDFENDNPDIVGVMAVLLPAGELVRTEPPGEQTEGNREMPSRRLSFRETRDIPEAYDGPWSADLKPKPGRSYSDLTGHFRELNFENMLGYARATTGDDPTPNKQSRHLILLENEFGCRFHIQIPEDQLAARNFGAITLNWVDFD